jgi:hypothetical protein
MIDIVHFGVVVFFTIAPQKKNMVFLPERHSFFALTLPQEHGPEVMDDAQRKLLKVKEKEAIETLLAISDTFGSQVAVLVCCVKNGALEMTYRSSLNLPGLYSALEENNTVKR